ncbi:MAG: non-canonical purine NTP pyrophosphatase, RdgB/HAM1 family [Chlamydia sp. 32-24]|nr:MAG: non-canonical purine NTP pyrophosphatase, RdgB/HAM1 family [Chlamydia sp. 32-24]
MEIVIASRNLHKVREIRDILKKYPRFDVLSLINFPNYQLIEETGASFLENAVLKATHAAKSLNKWVIADDSGLVVPALKGEPGLLSRRYASIDATDAENRQKLLKNMSHLRDIDRCAYFECSLCLASPEGVKKKVSATCEGAILTQEKGSGGFGYDSLFVKEGHSSTFAQMDEKTKNKISHRRKALEKLFSALESVKE